MELDYDHIPRYEQYFRDRLKRQFLLHNVHVTRLLVNDCLARVTQSRARAHTIALIPMMYL